MLWKGWQSLGTSRTVEGPGAALAGRVAVVFALIGLLALLAAGVALSSLRPRRRLRTLHLEGLRAPDPAHPGGMGRIPPPPPGSQGAEEP
jgi:hypothetical protein